MAYELVVTQPFGPKPYGGEPSGDIYAVGEVISDADEMDAVLADRGHCVVKRGAAAPAPVSAPTNPAPAPPAAA